MFSCFCRQPPKAVGSVTLLVLLACLIVPQVAFTTEAPFDEKTPVAQEKNFPGFNEVIPRATSVSARIFEAGALIHQTANLGYIYAKLDKKIEVLEKLEE